MLIVAIKEDLTISHSLQSPSLLLRSLLRILLAMSFYHVTSHAFSVSTQQKPRDQPVWQLLSPHNSKALSTTSLHLICNGDKLKSTHCINSFRPDLHIFPFIWCCEANLLCYNHTGLSSSCVPLLGDRIIILKCHKKSCMKFKDNWHGCCSSRL